MQVNEEVEDGISGPFLELHRAFLSKKIDAIHEVFAKHSELKDASASEIDRGFTPHSWFWRGWLRNHSWQSRILSSAILDAIAQYWFDQLIELSNKGQFYTNPFVWECSEGDIHYYRAPYFPKLPHYCNLVAALISNSALNGYARHHLPGRKVIESDWLVDRLSCLRGYCSNKVAAGTIAQDARRKRRNLIHLGNWVTKELNRANSGTNLISKGSAKRKRGKKRKRNSNCEETKEAVAKCEKPIVCMDAWNLVMEYVVGVNWYEYTCNNRKRGKYY